MIALFRINDPFRVILVLILMVVARLPIFWADTPWTLPEIEWNIIGHALGQGKNMYVDIWDNMGPLSSATYWMITSLFGDSRLVPQVIAIGLVLYQGLIFNIALIRIGVYKEKSYIPALLYGLFAFISYDFLLLSPALMALTFLMLALKNVLKLDTRNSDVKTLSTGIYLGIASLIYLPSIIFLLMGLISIALYRLSSIRQLFMVLYGAIFAWTPYLLFLYFYGSLGAFFEQYVLSGLSVVAAEYTDWIEVAIMMGLPIFFLIWSMLKTFSYTGFINFQVSCQQIMLIWVIACGLSVLFSNTFALFQFVVLLPALSFFGTHFFLIMRNRLMVEVYFLLISVSTILIMYTAFYQEMPYQMYSQLQNSTKLEIPQTEEKQKIWVLGSQLGYYEEQLAATPYIHWGLLKAHYGAYNTYSEITEIYDNILQDLPDYMVSELGHAEDLFSHMPILETQYELYKEVEETKIYKLK